MVVHKCEPDIFSDYVFLLERGTPHLPCSLQEM